LTVERLYVSALTNSNSAPNFSEIEQSAAQLITAIKRLKIGGPTHLGF